MIKSFIKHVFEFIAVIVVLAMVVVGYRVITSPEPIKSAFTHEEVAKINPVMIIDKYTLSSEEHFKDWDLDVTERLVNIGAMYYSESGLQVTQGLQGYSIPVIIQSGGGLVKLGLKLERSINALRNLSGLKVHCYVGEAQSMAFYLMVTMCDKVIAKRSARLMQHRVSYGPAGVTPSTYLSDIELSRKESIALGVKYDEWHNLARGPEDHVFNLLEIEKYKLVDEWID